MFNYKKKKKKCFVKNIKIQMEMARKKRIGYYTVEQFKLHNIK